MDNQRNLILAIALSFLLLLGWVALEKESAKIDRAVAKAREAERKFDRAEAMKLVHEGTFGDPSRIASGEIEVLAADALTELSLDAPEPVQGSLMPSHRPDDRRRALADSLVREARAIAAEQRFFHWEVAFPGVWRDLSSSGRSGGFDAVIGNPPYVRQEEISPIKPALSKAFDTYAGTADLYVYFYERRARSIPRPVSSRKRASGASARSSSTSKQARVRAGSTKPVRGRQPRWCRNGSTRC